MQGQQPALEHSMPDTPLRRSKPHCILCALRYRVRGFAVERQHLRRTPTNTMRTILPALFTSWAIVACHSTSVASSGRDAPQPGVREPACAPGGGDTTRATYFEFQVGGAPRQLVAGPVSAGTRGAFVVQFVVDTAGIPVSSSVKVVGPSPNEGVASSELATSVSRLRYEPVSYHGCRIWLVLQEPWR
jgi:hypothetical protein